MFFLEVSNIQKDLVWSRVHLAVSLQDLCVTGLMYVDLKCCGGGLEGEKVEKEGCGLEGPWLSRSLLLPP